METAADLAKQSGEALQEIVTKVEASADQVSAIAAASEQQSATSDEINHSVSQINDLSHGISKNVHLANETIDEVSGMAGRLNELVERFKR